MAPFLGPTLQELLAQLRSNSPAPPIRLGFGAPTAQIDTVDGMWLLRELVDDAEANAPLEQHVREKQARGEPYYYMPGMRKQKPGRTIARAATPQALADLIERMELRSRGLLGWLRAARDRWPGGLFRA